MREIAAFGGTISGAMANQDAREQDGLLSPREAAHLRARERKRSTRMVVDNAGVKRILQARHVRALEERATAEKSAAGENRSGGTPSR
jgi:outer membrane lipoprotein SlyB